MPGNPGQAASIDSKARFLGLPPSGDEWLITFQNHPRFEKRFTPAREITINDGITIAGAMLETPGGVHPEPGEEVIYLIFFYYTLIGIYLHQVAIFKNFGGDFGAYDAG